MTDTLPVHLDLWQQTLHWQPTAEQQSLFQTLYNQIVEGNQRFNLTRITTPEDFWEKHLWDSLSGLAPWLSEGSEESSEGSQALEESQVPEESETIASLEPHNVDPIRVIDIGTGGGIPGIPAAIALGITQGNVDLTLVDSTRKKIQFLQTACQQMGLEATCIADRAEALGQQSAHREQYDLALVRAVGSAATCAEYAIPLLKVGAQAVLFRGQWNLEDTEALAPVVELLGGEITDLQSWQTPLTQSIRHCIFIYKEKPTPSELPRAVGVPSKKPLD